MKAKFPRPYPVKSAELEACLLNCTVALAQLGLLLDLINQKSMDKSVPAGLAYIGLGIALDMERQAEKILEQLQDAGVKP